MKATNRVLVFNQITGIIWKGIQTKRLTISEAWFSLLVIVSMPWLVFGLCCGWATGRLTEGSGGDRKFVKRRVRSADIGNCSDRDAAITTHLTHSVRAFNSLPHSVRFHSISTHLLLASLAHKEGTRDVLVAYLFERSNNLISIWGSILTLNTCMKHFISDTYRECDLSSNGRWLEYCRFISYTNLLGSTVVWYLLPKIKKTFLLIFFYCCL